MSLANALIIKKPIITFFTNTILNTLGKKGVIYFKKFEVNDLRNIIIKNILNKKNSVSICLRQNRFIEGCELAHTANIQVLGDTTFICVPVPAVLQLYL